MIVLLTEMRFLETQVKGQGEGSRLRQAQFAMAFHHLKCCLGDRWKLALNLEKNLFGTQFVEINCIWMIIDSVGMNGRY